MIKHSEAGILFPSEVLFSSCLKKVEQSATQTKAKLLPQLSTKMTSKYGILNQWQMKLYFKDILIRLQQ